MYPLPNCGISELLSSKKIEQLVAIGDTRAIQDSQGSPLGTAISLRWSGSIASRCLLLSLLDLGCLFDGRLNDLLFFWAKHAV